MKIQEAYNLFDRLKIETTKKSEIKVYEKFLHILSELNDREFSKKEIQFIEKGLDSLDLESNPKYRKRYFRKALNKFETSLKDRLSLTTSDYYTNLGITLGSSFGMLFGLVVFSSLERSMGLVVGMAIGMLIGQYIGSKMDSQAKIAGNML